MTHVPLLPLKSINQRRRRTRLMNDGILNEASSEYKDERGGKKTILREKKV